MKPTFTQVNNSATTMPP